MSQFWNNLLFTFLKVMLALTLREGVEHSFY